MKLLAQKKQSFLPVSTKPRRGGQAGGGFSIIEMIVALGLFTVVVLVSMSALLSLVAANEKVQTRVFFVNNLNLAVEDIARNMRVGTQYHCGPLDSTSFTEARNCSTGGSVISFIGSQGNQFVYRLTGNTIEKSKDGGNNFVDLTASDINVESFRFFVNGTEPPGDNIQPRAVILIKGDISSLSRFPSGFTIQTSITQRLPDS